MLPVLTVPHRAMLIVHMWAIRRDFAAENNLANIKLDDLQGDDKVLGL